MHIDPTKDQAELQRQERRFVWQLIGFTVIVCLGGLLFVTIQGPKIAADRHDSKPYQIVKKLQDDESTHNIARAALEKLKRFRAESQAIDKRAKDVNAKIDDRLARNERFDDLLPELEELEKQTERNARLLDEFTAAIEGLPPEQRETVMALQVQVRESYRQVEASRKKSRSSLERLRSIQAELDRLNKQP